MSEEANLEELAKQRRRLVSNRLATVVSVGEDLLTVLDSPISSTAEDLLSALAGLATMTDPHRSADWTREIRSPNNETTVPNFQPAWASQKIEQIDRQLYELAGAIHGWCARPADPTDPSTCDKCDRKRGRDDLYCRHCGTPTLHAYRRCWVRACPNRGKQRSKCPPHIEHPHPTSGTVPPSKRSHPSNTNG